MADDHAHDDLRGIAMGVCAETIRAAHEQGKCLYCMIVAMAEAALAMALAKYFHAKNKGKPNAEKDIAGLIAHVTMEGMTGGKAFAVQLGKLEAKESAEDFMSGIMAAASQGRPN